MAVSSTSLGEARAMKRTLKMSVEVTLDDLPAAERKELAEGAMCKPSELPRLKDIEDAFDVAEALCFSFESDPEVWAGTGMYCRVAGYRITAHEFSE